MNNRGSSSNTFAGGLVLDLNPLITPNDVLTDCLNGTIITNNGNENVLLNDMGNARVETAYLPEGYIPVGSCEFGDIIYIASYNPLINKCLLGCFPSPQRNILSENITDLQLTLTNSEFQETKSDTPTGDLKQTTLKKIIYENNLTSGDKYIICAEGLNFQTHLSDQGNTDHEFGRFPKLFKIKVISIEEDGKITELSDGLKWYPNNIITEEGTKEETPYDYFIQNGVRDNQNKIDLDVWRSAVSSAYAIFSSKISGKLALMIELETITGFSCTWGIDELIPYEKPKESKNTVDVESSDTSKIIYTNYPIYLSINWETENNNINPSKIEVTGHWLNKEKNEEGKEKLSVICPSTIDKENKSKIEIDDYEEKIIQPISRLYKLESNINYEEFKNTYSYEAQSLKRLNDLKKKTNLDIVKVYSAYPDNTEVEENNIKNNITNYYLNGNIEIKDYIHDDIINNYFKTSIKKEYQTFILPTNEIYTKGDDKNNLTYNAEFDLSKCIYEYIATPCMPFGRLNAYSVVGLINFSKIGKKLIQLNTWKYFNQEGYITLTWGYEAYTEPNHKISKVTMDFYDNLGHVANYEVTNKDSFNGIFTNYILLNSQDSKLTYDNTDNRKVNDDIKDMLYSNSLYLVKITAHYGKVNILGEVEEIEEIIEYRWLWTTKMFNDSYFLVPDFKNNQFILDLDCDLSFKSNKNWDFKEIDQEQHDYSDGKGTDIIHARVLKLVENDDGNIDVTIKGKLLKDYNCFELKDGIEYKVYIPGDKGKEPLYPRISTIPELPLVLFSDKSITPSEHIYPEAFNRDNSNYLLNRGSLKLTGNTDSDDNFTYVNGLGETDSRLNCKYKSGNLKNNFGTVSINASITDYSRYYYTEKSGYKDAYILRSFLTEETDYDYYHLDKDTGFFTTVLGFGNVDLSGKDARVVFGNFDLSYVTEDNVTNIDKITFRDYGVSVYEGNQGLQSSFDNANAIKNAAKHLKFLFPYTTIGFHDEKNTWNSDLSRIDTKKSNATLNTKVISQTMHFHVNEVGSTASNYYKNFIENRCVALGGIGYVSKNDSELIISDCVKEERYYHENTLVNSRPEQSPMFYGRKVTYLLKHSFYLSSDTTQVKYTSKNNWIFLKNYNTLYVWDVVVNLLSSDNENNDIKFTTQTTTISVDDIFKNYVDKIIELKEIKEVTELVQKLITNSPNIKLKFNSIQKTFPLLLQIPYLAPEIQEDSNKVLIVIESDESVKQIAEDIISKKPFNDFLRNKIYYLVESKDPTESDFQILNFKHIIPDNNEKYTLSKLFISTLAMDSNNRLYLSESMSGNGTYSIYTHEKRAVMGCPKDVEIFIKEKVNNG